VIDTSGVKNIDLFIDGLSSGINSNNTSDTTFEFIWQTTSFADGSEPKLYIHASDNEGNDTISQIIRVMVDNNHSYPNPVDLDGIDSIFTSTDTTLIIPNIIESEYYLYQIITKDAWELETRGQVITASSFYKFANHIGGAENDELYAVIIKDDGGYLAVGGSFNQGSWLVNINSLGAVEDSVYFGEAHSGFRDIANALDGGFILTGYSRIDEKENIPYFFVFFINFTKLNKLSLVKSGLISKSRGYLFLEIFNKSLSNGTVAFLFLLIFFRLE